MKNLRFSNVRWIYSGFNGLLRYAKLSVFGWVWVC